MEEQEERERQKERDALEEQLRQRLLLQEAHRDYLDLKQQKEEAQRAEDEEFRRQVLHTTCHVLCMHHTRKLHLVYSKLCGPLTLPDLPEDICTSPHAHTNTCTCTHTATTLSVLLQMMAKFAEDDRLEQMNAQKRRMKQLEHRRAVEKLIEERRQQFQLEKVSGIHLHTV